MIIHNSGLNKKISIYKRALPIAYNDYSFCFEDLLNKDKSVTIHQGKLQQLAINIFKVKVEIAQMIMNKILTFVENDTYDLRRGKHLSRVNVFGHMVECSFTNYVVVGLSPVAVT